jgi:hypothetical protein
MLRFNKTIIRELAVCASLKLQYWCQLKYFVIKCTVQSKTLHCARYTHQQDWINIRPHD